MRTCTLGVPLLLVSGCATVNTGTPPTPPMSGSTCAFERSLTLVPASASLLVAEDTGFGLQVNPGSAPGFRSTGPARSRSAGASGHSFFLGSSRLTPRAGLERLNEPELVTRYDLDLAKHARGGIHRWARPVWITLMAGSIVALSAGLGLMFNAQATRPRGGQADYGPSRLALLSGAIGLGLMLPFVALDLLNREHEAQFVAREALLVAEGSELEDVRRAVATHNQRAADGCPAH